MSPEPNDHEGDAPPIARLNRYVLVVTPEQPFVDWVAALEEEDGVEEGEVRMTLEEAQLHHQATFLVPFSWEAEDVVEWIHDNVDLVFEPMLHDVEEDPARWPAERGAAVFEEWFSLDLLDAPIDLVDAPLYEEPPANEH